MHAFSSSQLLQVRKGILLLRTTTPGRLCGGCAGKGVRTEARPFSFFPRLSLNENGSDSGGIATEAVANEGCGEGGGGPEEEEDWAAVSCWIGASGGGEVCLGNGWFCRGFGSEVARGDFYANLNCNVCKCMHI